MFTRATAPQASPKKATLKAVPKAAGGIQKAVSFSSPTENSRQKRQSSGGGQQVQPRSKVSHKSKGDSTAASRPTKNSASWSKLQRRQEADRAKVQANLSRPTAPKGWEKGRKRSDSPEEHRASLHVNVRRVRERQDKKTKDKASERHKVYSQGCKRLTAVEQQCSNVVNVLFEHGASVTFKDDQMARDYADTLHGLGSLCKAFVDFEGSKPVTATVGKPSPRRASLQTATNFASAMDNNTQRSVNRVGRVVTCFHNWASKMASD